MTHLLSDLLVENLVEPLGLATDSPRFSWTILTSERGVVQRAYEIEILDRESAVIASSGRVNSRDSVLVELPLLRLQSRSIYRWRVRNWLVGKSEPSPWAVAAFETNLLDESEWVAKWVTPVQEPTLREWYTDFSEMLHGAGPQGSPESRLRPPQLLRQEFRVASPVRRARLYASAHGVFEAEINGKSVSDQLLSPGFESYDSVLSYPVFDVTSVLHPGDNVIGMTVADGWYAGRIGLTGSSANYGDRLSALWQLELEHDDGSVSTVSSGPSVTSSTGALRYSDLFIGEMVDARQDQPGWSTPAFDADRWLPVEVGGIGQNLVPFLGEPIRRTEEFAPDSILTTPIGETVIDLGQVIAGRMRVSLHGPAGSVLRLEHSEVLDEHGNFFQNILGPNKDQTDIYITAGLSGGETFEPRFTFHGFRYVRITGDLEQLVLDEVSAVVIGSDLRKAGSLQTSDARLNRLHENVVWSQRANLLSIPTDCPQRERAGWTGDIQVFAPAATNNQWVSSFLTRWLTSVRSDQMPDGRVPNIVPFIPSFAAAVCTPETAMGIGMGPTSAAWGDAIAMVPDTLHSRYGDRRVLGENFDAMLAWVDFQCHEAGNALPVRLAGTEVSIAAKERQQLLWNTGFHFGDWLAPSTLTEAAMPEAMMVAPARTGELVAAMFHIHTMDIVAGIATVLKRQREAERLTARASAARTAFAGEYLRDGLLPVQLQGLYVLALAFGLIPEPAKEGAVEQLVNLIHAADGHLDTGFVSVPYLLDVLWDNDQRKLARALLWQETAPSWLYQVDRGATTMWETWTAVRPDGSVEPVSMNHYAFGCVDDFLFRRIAGITPIEPGYRLSRIEPDFECGLAQVKASRHTPYGELTVEWRLAVDEVALTVTVPHNTQAEIFTAQGSILVGSGRHERTLGLQR